MKTQSLIKKITNTGHNKEDMDSLKIMFLLFHITRGLNQWVNGISRTHKHILSPLFLSLFLGWQV